MSYSEIVLTLSEARQAVQKVVDTLSPYCHIINVAGSIRREQSHVNDLEVVCAPIREPHVIPAYRKVMQADLLGGESMVKVIDEEKSKTVYKPLRPFVSIVEGWQKVKGMPDGRYTQRILPNGMKLDLFMTTVEDYYRIFAMRTGSKEYSKEVIAMQWVRKGWRGTKDGLRRSQECRQTSAGWECMSANPTLPPVWQTEEEFFKFISVVHIHPKNRY